MAKTFIFDLKLLGVQAVSDLSTQTALLTKQKDDLRISMGKLRKEMRDTTKTHEEQYRAAGKLAKEQSKVKEINRELSSLERKRVATGQKLVKTVESEVGAYRKLSAQEAAITAILKDLLAKKAQGIALSKAEAAQFTQLSVLQKTQITQLKTIDGALGRSGRSVGDYALSWKSLKTSMLSVVGAGGPVLIGITLLGVIGRKFSEAKNFIKEFDEGVADVSKTTNLAVPEARELAKQVSQINTRTSVSELLKLATAAGRLGLSKSDVIGFTEEADKLFVGLGDSLDGDAEQISIKIAKIAGNFKLLEELGVATSINTVGSVINELGATTKAQEAPMLDFISRLSGIAEVAGITLPQVAALAATFDAGNQSIEIAATTLQRILPELATRAERFSEVANLGNDPSDSLQKFTKLLEEDAFQALVAVSEGAQSSEKGLIALKDIVESFDLEAARSAQIVTFLSGNLGELEKNLITASAQMENSTSINDEAAKKQATLNAEVENTDRAYESLIVSLDSGDGVFSKLLINFEKMKRGLYEMTAAVNDGEIGWGKYIHTLFDSRFSETLKDRQKAMNSFIDNLKVNAKEIAVPEGGLSSAQVEKLTDYYDNLGISAEKQKDKISALRKELISINKQVDSVGSGANKGGNNPVEKARRLADSIDTSVTSYKAINAQVKILEEALSSDAVDSKSDEFKVLNDKLTETKNRLKDARQGFFDLVKEDNKIRGIDEAFGKEAQKDLENFESFLQEISPGIADITEQQIKYQKELDKLVAGSEAYQKVEDKLRSLSEAYDEMVSVDKPLNLLSPDITKQEKTGFITDNFLDESVRERAERLLNVEYDFIEEFYDKKENTLQEAFLKVLLGGDPEAIKSATIKLNKDLLRDELSALERRSVAIGENQDEFGVQAAASSQELIDIKRREIALKQELAQIDIDAEKEANEKKLKDKKEFQKKLERVAFDGARRLAGVLADNEIDGIEARKDRAIEALEAEYDKKRELAVGNAQLIENLDAQQAKKKLEIEKKAAKEKQRIRILEAIAETALSVIEASPNPFAMAAAGVVGAIQLAIISAQKFERGGKLDSKGNIIGPSHSQGGVQIDGIEAEGGERRTLDEHGNINYINKKSNSRFKPTLDVIHNKIFPGKAKMLSRINSYNGYGVPLAREGARISQRPGSQVPKGVLQVVASNNLTAEDVSIAIQNGINNILPQLSSAVQAGAHVGSFGGSAIGTEQGLKKTADQQSAEAALTKRRSA